METEPQDTEQSPPDPARPATEEQGQSPPRPGSPTTEPRGNPPADDAALEEGIDKLEQAGGGH